MFTLKAGNEMAYNYQEILLDTEDELSQINVNELSVGSIAYVIATKTLYMLNSKKQWIEQ